MSRDTAWQKIFDAYNIHEHDFESSPYPLSNALIKAVSRHFDTTSDREVRVLCKMDMRESCPAVFRENGLFLLPTTNKSYVIVKGEGYIDIPAIEKTSQLYISKLDYPLETSIVGDSEMQHVDFAYASSLIRTALNDESLVLTIRGRKYTPKFSFRIGSSRIVVDAVQTEVDAGYEGRTQVVLVEAKSARAKNTIIRQLFYPYRQWQSVTKKSVIPLFFSKDGDDYSIWQFKFTNPDDYNSIELVNSFRYRINAPKL